MNEQFFWFLARASGIAAWALAMASVLWGTALATRTLGRGVRPAWLLDLHRHLGGLTVSLVVVHLGALAADGYVHFGWADTFVPFASEWRPAAVAWGVIGFWLLLVVEGTSLLMKRIPKGLWRGVHLTSYVVAGLTTAHLFAAGTDASHPAVVAGAALTGVALLFMVWYRVFFVRPSAGARAERPAVADDRAPVAPDRARRLTTTGPVGDGREGGI